MKYLSMDFLYSLSFSLIFGVAGYLLSGGDPNIAIFCFIIGFWAQDSHRLGEKIKQKDKEIEILKYEVYDEPEIKRIKKLAIDVLQKEQDEEHKKESKTRNTIWAISLTILPFLVYAFTPGLADTYFHIFSGRIVYMGQDHYFGFSPTFVLDLPYFLPLVIWALALWFCIKTRKQIENHKSFFNYFVLVLVVLNSMALVYSLWFIYSYFSDIIV